MNETWAHWLFTVGAAVLVSGFAYYKQWLTLSGTGAAACVGASLFGFGGWQGALPLLIFFFSSTLIPRLFGRREKSERRNAAQVFANGGIAALCAWITALDPERAALWWTGCLAALAEANGDTWATELGTRLGKNPHMITTWKPAHAGVSGAITFVGTVANILGVVIIVGISALPLGLTLWQAVAAIVCAFLAGLLDSVFGATLQARFRCTVCRKSVERHTHCGNEAQLSSGLRWLGNSEVNLVCSAAACAMALAMVWII